MGAPLLEVDVQEGQLLMQTSMELLSTMQQTHFYTLNALERFTGLQRNQIQRCMEFLIEMGENAIIVIGKRGGKTRYVIPDNCGTERKDILQRFAGELRNRANSGHQGVKAAYQKVCFYLNQ